MRIALLTRRFDPRGGGTERDLIVTAQSLREAGHEVTIYAAEVRGMWQGTVVRRVPAPRFPRVLALLGLAYMASPAARRDGAELVVSFARVLGADVLRSGGGAHISYVRAARQWRGVVAAAAMWSSPYHRAQMIIEKRAFSDRSLRKVVAVSNSVRDDLLRQFGLAPAGAATLYNGIDLEGFTPVADAATRARLREHLGLGDPTPVVIFVGNGFGRKGLGQLLRAWPRLTTSPRLWVVGDDRGASSYRRLASRLGIDDRVRFLGRQGRVHDLLRAADVLALPSLFEPFGNVVMEAMAFGVPALTSARSGVAEVIPAGWRQFLVNDPSDPEEIAARLDALIAERGDAARLARPTAERFTWRRYAGELIRILNSVVAPQSE